MVFAALKRIFAPSAQLEEAHRLYEALVTQARQPVFYRDWQVPDTVNGRFDVIALHMHLVIHRLRETPQTDRFIRTLSEVFFSDMDRCLREMGSTDTGVGLRVKKMAKALYGRLYAYEQANGSDALKAALLRNLYRSVPPSEAIINALLHYIAQQRAILAAQGTASLMQGDVRFE